MKEKKIFKSVGNRLFEIRGEKTGELYGFLRVLSSAFYCEAWLPEFEHHKIKGHGMKYVKDKLMQHRAKMLPIITSLEQFK